MLILLSRLRYPTSSVVVIAARLLCVDSHPHPIRPLGPQLCHHLGHRRRDCGSAPMCRLSSHRPQTVCFMCEDRPHAKIFVASSTIAVRWSVVYFSSGVSTQRHLPCAARIKLEAPAAAAAVLPPRRKYIGVISSAGNELGMPP